MAATVGMPATVIAREDPDEDEPPIFESEHCAEVRLQVQDGKTGLPVKGVWVDFPPRGASEGEDVHMVPGGRTDKNGTFVFPRKAPSWAVVRKTGYSSVQVSVPCATSATAIALVLFETAAEFSEESSAGGDAHRRVDGEVLESMAGTPRNVFQAVQTLPGVVRPTFSDTLLTSVLGTSGMAVRGARPGESKTYLDGIEIPYFYHYLGLSSVLPAEMLDFAELVPSGAGPQFGRLTGGVIDARSRAFREAEDDHWHGRANLTFFEGNAIARGPVGNGVLSISDRTSLWDLVSRANNTNWGDGIPVWGYNDFQGVYRTPLTDKHELTALVVGAWDDISFADRPTQVRTEFYRAGATWKMILPEQLYRFSASYGYDQSNIHIDEPGGGLHLTSRNRVHDVRLMADAEINLHKVIPALRTGVEVHGVRPEIFTNLDWEVQELIILDRSYYDYGIWAGTWVEAEIRPIPSVVLLPGLRFDYDTMVGHGWLDPRLTARWFIDKNTTASVSGGLYHKPQPFHLAFVDQEHLGLTDAQQLSGGVERRFGDTLSVDVRGYWNTFKDQIQGITLLPVFEGDITGDGESYGGEVYVNLVFFDDKLRGQFGYTLSRTNWRNQGTEWKTTASDLDVTHGATAVTEYRLPRHWTIGGRMRLYSGFPYTTWDADVYIPDLGGYVGVGESPWEGRAPWFYQLDVRVTKRWRVQQRIQIETFFDLQNATFRQNADRYASGFRPSVPAPQGGLPFFPSLGVSGTF